jgi:hypothetical protein
MLNREMRAVPAKSCRAHEGSELAYEGKRDQIAERKAPHLASRDIALRVATSKSSSTLSRMS